MQVEHELNQRTMQPGQAALKDTETGTGQFCRRLEIHLTQFGTEVDMIARRERGHSRLAPGTNLDIAGLIRSIRHGFVQQVRQIPTADHSIGPEFHRVRDRRF